MRISDLLRSVAHVTPLLLAAGAGTAVASDAVAPTALPTGGTIAAGSGSITANGAHMLVQQNSQRLIANWQSFNVGRDAVVQFVQPDAQAAALNRVTAGDASFIMGQIQSNGRVFLVNPSGVVFGATARVDVGGLVASTGALSDADFLSGRADLHLGPGAGPVMNLGQLATREGGFVALVGATVDNAGRIVTPGGQAVLAAGGRVRLDITGSGLAGVEVDAGQVEAQIRNGGVIAADGGRVWLSARQMQPAVATAISQTGTIQADSVAERGGEIWLDGGPTGAVELAGTLSARGTAAGETGGRIVATGGDVTVTGSIDASGSAGGGQVMVGGGWKGRDPSIPEARSVTVEQGASITVSAVDTGRGGTAVVWSREATEVRGTVAARGAGTGKGGDVETSSRGRLAVGGAIDVGAPSGQGGTWLLDPTNVNIVSSGGGAIGTAAVNASVIEATLNTGGSVTIEADQDIQIDSDIAKTAGGVSTLTFQAGRNITLGAPGVSRRISATNNAATPTVTSSLNVVFIGRTGQPADLDNGAITIFGEISTNGGNADFFKAATLSSARPVSTRVLSANPTNPSAATTPDSGSVTFHRDVTLAGTSSITIDTQSVQDDAQVYLRRGGSVDFRGAIRSLDPNSPRALVINTTGAVSIQPGFPGSVGGDGLANYSGNVTFGGRVGTSDAPLDSLTLVGPSNVFLNTDQINLRRQAGETMTFSAPGSFVPSLVLGRQNTTISVTGFSAGSADYRQTSFDIVAGAGLTAPSTLDIRSDRSILLVDRRISGERQGGGAVPLAVSLLPSQRAAANSGSITLQNAQILSQGAAVTLGTAAQRAFGVATEQNTDGIRIQSSDIVTVGGALEIWGNAPTSAVTGGAAINIFGNSNLLTQEGSLLIDGRVASTSGGADKDAVLIGNRGQATVTVATTSGALTIHGDAGAVGLAATAGASYNGVEISDAAMIRTTTGALQVTGKGGGGNNNNIGENHGIRISDAHSQIVSTAGTITLTGVTGGKSTSYGLFTAGDSIALGQERNRDTNVTVDGRPVFVGDVNLIADTMRFINTSTSRLRVQTTGIVNVRPYNDAAIQIGGTEPSPPSPTNPAWPSDPTAVPATLHLASGLFSGRNAVFLEGARELNIGGFGSAAYGSAVGVAESTNVLTVAGATTINDRLNLLMLGQGGRMVLSAPLTVQGSDAGARTVNIETNDSILGTGTSSLISAAMVRLDAGGNIDLSGPNLIGTLAARSGGGYVRVNAAQALRIGDVATTLRGSTPSSSGVVVTNQGIALSTTSGAITQERNLTAGTGTVSLAAAGAVDQTGAATITAGRLAVSAGANATLANVNQVGVLAGNVIGDLVFNAADGISVESVTNSAGQTVVGLRTTGNAFLRALNGSIVQTARVATGGLAARATGDIDLSLAPATNALGTLAAFTTGGQIAVRNSGTLTVGTVGAAGSPLALSGVVTQAAGRDIALATLAGNIGLAQNVTAGAAAVSEAQRGIVRLEATAGAIQQTGASVVSARQLSLVARSTSALGNDNLVSQISGRITGAGEGLTFVGAGPVQVTGVTGVNGRGGEVLVGAVTGLSVAGDASLVARGGGISQTQDIAAGGLHARAVAGDVLLDRAGNAIGRLSGSTEAAGAVFTVRDRDGLRVGTVAGVTGITTNDGAVALTSLGTAGAATNDLIVDGAILSGTAASSLNADLGSILVSAGRSITGATTTLTAQQGVTVAGTVRATQGAATLTASRGDASISGRLQAADAVAVSAGGGVIVSGTVVSDGAAIALTASGNDAAISGTLQAATGITVQAARNATLSGSVTAATGQVAVNAGNDVSTAGTFQSAAALTLAAGRNATLSGTLTATSLTATAGNDLILSAAATANGPLALSAGRTASVTGTATSSTAGVTVAAGGEASVPGTVNAATGISLTAGGPMALGGQLTTTAGSLAATATGNLTANGALTAQAGSIRLSSLTGAVTQSAAGRVVAESLAVRAFLGSVFAGTANNVATIAARVTGADQGFAFADTDGLTVGTVDGLTGVSSNGGDIALQVTGGTGDLTLAGAVTTGYAGGAQGGSVLLRSAGGGVVSATAAGTVTAYGLAARAATGVSLDGANDVGVLAARTTAGAVSFRDASGFEVGSVAVTVPTVSALTGVSTAEGNGAVTLLAGAGPLVFSQDVNAGTGAAVLRSGGDMLQTGGAIRAGGVRLTSDGNVDLGAAGNRVGTLSARVRGSFVFQDAGPLTIASQSLGDGTALSGVSADGRIQIRSGGAMTLDAPVNGRGSGSEAVVLSAGGIFTNRAGSAGVTAINGRWLVYDVSPVLEYRLGGLPVAFIRQRTSFDGYGPASVLEPGNGYITTAGTLDPDQSLRHTGGSTAAAATTANVATPVSLRTAQAVAATTGTGIAAVAYGQPLTGLSLVAAAPFGAGGSGLGAGDLGAVLRVPLAPSRAFRSDLGPFLQGGVIRNVMLAGGRPLPGWVQLDPQARLLLGHLPAEVRQPVLLEVDVAGEDGQARRLSVELAPIPQEGEADQAF